MSTIDHTTYLKCSRVIITTGQYRASEWFVSNSSIRLRPASRLGWCDQSMIVVKSSNAYTFRETMMKTDASCTPHKVNSVVSRLCENAVIWSQRHRKVISTNVHIALSDKFWVLWYDQSRFQVFRINTTIPVDDIIPGGKECMISVQYQYQW